MDSRSPGWRWRFPSPRRVGRRQSRASSLRVERGEGDSDEDGNNNPTTRSHHSAINVSSAAALFRLGPKPSSASPDLPRRLSRPGHSSTNMQGSVNNSTPFLTMALLKLEQVFPEFCLNLSQANFEAVTRACAILDSSIATASSVGNSPSPQRRGSPRSPMLHKGFLNWLPERNSSPNNNNNSGSNRNISRSLSPPTSSSAMALESEWGGLQHGLVVLAAAEYLYKDVQQSKKGRSLRGLYEYVLVQLEQVHATLCEPFLAIPAATTSRENKYVVAAKSVAKTLTCLLTLCQVRIQLIGIQSNLFTVSLLDQVKESITTLLVVTDTSLQGGQEQQEQEQQTIEKDSVPTTTAADSVKDALLQELKLWKHLLEASAGLERCEFLSTLIGLRHCQKNLQLPARTRLEKWFDETCRVLVSLLPIYFDRVSAFTNPLYGFDPIAATTSTFQDWEAKVTEFLRKQKQSGGPPTAVTIVLDAVGADNLHPERGYQIIRDVVNDGDDVEGEVFPDSVLWPPVYMRNTAYLDAGSQHQRLHHNKMSSSAVNRRQGSSSFLPEWSSAQNITSDRSSVRSSSRNLDVDPHVLSKKRVLEYGPDSGTKATSWPHSEWESLVDLLEISPVHREGDLDDSTGADGIADPICMTEEPVAVTFRQGDDGFSHSETDPRWKPAFEKAVRLFGVYASSEMNAVNPHTVREHEKRRSTYHIVSLSKYLSMVIMVKEDEESHFLRRRTPMTDEEIRAFMDKMAAHWQISRRFSHESLPKPLSSARIELIHDEWDAEKIEELISKVKSALGLRPTSYPLGEGHRGISFLGRSSPKKISRRVRESPSEDDTQSAAALFLGAQLANLFDP